MGKGELTFNIMVVVRSKMKSFYHIRLNAPYSLLEDGAPIFLEVYVNCVSIVPDALYCRLKRFYFYYCCM